MINQQSYIIKKYISGILKDKYTNVHDEILDRISQQIITQKDIEYFGKLIMDIYTTGFMQCAKDNEEMLHKLGYTTKLKEEVKQPIFEEENHRKQIFKEIK